MQHVGEGRVLERFVKDERGQTAVEYATVLVIVVAVVGVLVAVDWAGMISTLLNQISVAV
jgi:Flp pilus assembly pilin Flp